MNKAMLVASREYVENLRTKTFWIGILSLPIILVLSVLVPQWLDSAKDVRRFVIIDQSGWLLGKMEEQSRVAQLERPLLYIRITPEPFFRGFDKPEDLPSLVRRAAHAQAEGRPLTAEEMQALQKFSLEQMEKLSPQEKKALTQITFEDVQSLSALNQEQVAAVRALTPERRIMLRGLSSEEAEALVRESLGVPFGISVQQLDTCTGLTLEERRALMLAINPDLATEQKGDKLETGRDVLEVIPSEIPADGREAWAREQLAEGKIFAYFVIGENPLKGSEGCLYVSSNRTDLDLKSRVQRMATAEVRRRLIQEEGISQEVSQQILGGLSFLDKKVDQAGQQAGVEESDVAHQWAPVGFVYMLWIAVFVIAQMLLTNTIEEKSNRIIEVLLSSVSPLQLMTGKIVGIAVTGLTVVVSWVISFLIVLKYLPLLMGWGTLPFDLSTIASDPIFLVSFVVYFLLGYLLYAAILVGFGSVCNSLKEAQNLMQPVTIILMVPLLAMIPVSQDPNGKLAKVLSFFPPFTPFVMMNRAAGPPALWEYVVTTILLLVSIVVAFWMAAKVFRVGVLMTGKVPTIFEILRWIRTPVGSIVTSETEVAESK